MKQAIQANGAAKIPKTSHGVLKKPVKRHDQVASSSSKISWGFLFYQIGLLSLLARWFVGVKNTTVLKLAYGRGAVAPFSVLEETWPLRINDTFCS